MGNHVRAKGYTSISLILNMKHFIQDEREKRRLEILRGSDEFSNLIRHEWVPALQRQDLFVPEMEYRRQENPSLPPAKTMTPEEIGFATGAFRSLMLERFTFPTYRLDKSKITFPKELESNLQFKNLFKRTWDRWDICIRPTMTGFFVLRFTLRYENVLRGFLDLAKDVIRLQEPFDIPSALRWAAYKREKYADRPEELAKTEGSIKALLRWLGIPEETTLDTVPESFYYPVQWKLALEVGNYFVQAARLPLNATRQICLEPATRQDLIPMHDSYVIYHFNEVFAAAKAVQGPKAKNPTAQMPVTIKHITQSKMLRNAFTNLLEGSILREHRPNADDLDEKTPPPVESFPSPRWRLADTLVEKNLASWSDEICLLTSRTAIFVPSPKWRNHEMAVSTIPGSTLKVQYAQYWLGMRRLVEFVLEIRVLAQLIERESYRLLEDIADTIEKIRQGMFRGNIEFDGELKAHLARAAHLRRIVALAQSISHAPMWSRAEYAVHKAEYFMEVLDVPQIFEHIRRNVDSINSVADHVDELYLADLAERNNDKATLLSVGLAAASFILTLLVLPSFWADLINWEEHYKWGEAAVLVPGVAGSILALFLVFGALYLLMLAVKRRREVGEMLQQLFNGHPKAPSEEISLGEG